MCRINKYELVAEKICGYNADYIDKKIRDSADVAEFMMTTLKTDRYPSERFSVFMLDSKLRIIGFSDISIGNLDSAPVHPREVFQIAFATPKTAAIIVAHNHPSGDPTPSMEDIQVTERLSKAADILGIRLLDHVIAGDGCFVSMKGEGYL
ncbi:MAG: hypothetical protein IJH64_04635 [Oscillospiraceae bacterium]|nr:hypothetical protein [Oscillospiraceae bacterium]